MDEEQFRLNSKISLHTTKAYLIHSHQLNLESSNQISNTPSNSNPISGLMSSPSPITPVPLFPGNMVGIDDLVENFGKGMLSGRFILCRCLTPPLQESGIKTIVDDSLSGVNRAVQLNLLNYSNAPTEYLGTVLPVGTILAVANPWFGFVTDGLGGFYALHCDNPANVKIITATEFQNQFQGIQWSSPIPVEYRQQAITIT